MLSSRSPQKKRLAAWGYKQVAPGVYRSEQPLLSRIGLVLLNELPTAQPGEQHNAFVKIFASRQRPRSEAFERLDSSVESDEVEMYLLGLRRQLQKGEQIMSTAITPEDVLELGREYRRRIIETVAPEERLAGLEPEQRLAGLEPEERLAGLEPEERLAGLEPEERLAGLNAQELALLRQRLDE